MNNPAVSQGLLARFSGILPQELEPLSLGEGNTPLVRLRHLEATLAQPIAWYAKFEGANPTGSFKDRGMVVAVAAALHQGHRAVLCASTGNTSAAAAAYAAAAGMRAVVLIPHGGIAPGKLAQALVYGADVLAVEGNFDQAMTLVKEAGQRLPIALVNSINPYRLQGQKTIAYEVTEALGKPPDYHALPVGNAGNITAHWIGYSELAGCDTAACGWCQGHCKVKCRDATGSRPVMLGYQAAGSAPFIQGSPVADPRTIASAIRIGNPQNWDSAQTVIRESGGWFAAVTDEAILEAQALLASREGIFCEPASAASIAGVLMDVKAGRVHAGATVVSTLTGHGLKDPGAALAVQHVQPTVVPVGAFLDHLARMLEQPQPR
jgi:threonine synthase